MNKLILILLFASSVCNAQAWEEVEMTDDFGDKNGDIVLATQVKGYFSNSATVKSDCDVFLVKDGKRLYINILEYGNIKVKSTSYKNPTKLHYKNDKGKRNKMSLVNGKYGMYGKNKHSKEVLKGKSVVIYHGDGSIYKFTVPKL